jgi:peptidoglycan/xylan/chitin deacetylase (PgdA/CDA1 family)
MRPRSGLIQASPCGGMASWQPGLLSAAMLGIFGCSEPSPHATGEPAQRVATAPVAAATPAAAGAASLTQINGQSFPDHVIALTWDDGPDKDSLALAEYLRRERVSATFFVVSEWSREISPEPGEGTEVYATGYRHIPILARLVALGHRLGNHTLHHVLLTDVPPARADVEVRANQETIDPFLTNELRLFRAPGGAWNAAAASAIATDPLLADLVGPIRWDIDRKDWEASLACRSDRPLAECESAPVSAHTRVKPGVTAERYLESIEEAKHGIVLLHDRVGHVGSSYAMDLAQRLVPALKARGYIFAAPVLGFSPLVLRAPREPGATEARAVSFVDLDGDGRADLCVREAGNVVCARSVEVAGEASDPRPRTVFRGQLPAPTPARHADAGSALSNAGGDALAAVDGAGAVDPRTIRLGDLNGDGRADVCGRTPGGVACALSTARGFAQATLWLRDGMNDEDGWRDASEGRSASLQLADVNGDGRADLCADSPAGIVCGLAP